MLETEGRNFIVTHRGVSSLARLLNDHEKTRYSTDRIMAADPCPRKPESVALPALVDRYQLDPARCLVVGDRDSDVLSGYVPG